MSVDLASRLGRTVIYQIYPQSFADSNNDGIGDLQGIIGRIEYLAWLGVDAIWINPCFDSPFVDAGYDVSDFTRIAPRYGTNEDMVRLIEEAGEHGIAVLLDLVAGHTSDQHPWFMASRDDPDDTRYVWSNTPAQGFEPGSGARGGFYLPNFFPSQPALNFGYARSNPDQPWRLPVDAPGPQANRAALREIMSYWFDLGVTGFRVDLAASLVKDDPGMHETSRLWQEVRAWVDATYPGRILISEWGDPKKAVPAGFHADFFLQFGGEDDGLPLRSLWNNGAGTVSETWGDVPSWASVDARGDAGTFVAAWRDATEAIRAAGSSGFTGLPTSNHDFTRLVAGSRTAEQARCALVLALTWPSVPSIYYGDEIGMRYVPNTPTHEGSRLGPRYERAGSRTPMQWGNFSPTASRSRDTTNYLPLDPAPDHPTVTAQLERPSSLLHFVRELIALRHTDRRLDVERPVEVLTTGHPLSFVRDETLTVAINPGNQSVRMPLESAKRATLLIAKGAHVDDDGLRLDAFGYAILDRT